VTVNLWRKIAARYRNEPAVIGYDLLNEPIAHYFDTASLNPKLEPLYRRIVSGIREVDRNHIIFLGGAQWDTNFKIFGRPFDPKLAYTFHKYWMTVNQDAIQEYLTFRDEYNVPIWMGESERIPMSGSILFGNYSKLITSAGVSGPTKNLMRLHVLFR